MTLVLKDYVEIFEPEKHALNRDIDKAIEHHKHDSAKIAIWTMQAVSLATAVESRADQIVRQSFWEGLWYAVTGANRRITAVNQYELAKAQYLSQQVLVKLAEQNLLQFELISSIENKLNILAKDMISTNQRISDEIAAVNQRIFGVCKILSSFFEEQQRIKSELEELRRNDDLLFWKEIIRDEKAFQGKTYKELMLPERIVCVANDFFKTSKGKWGYRDLLFLKSAMREADIQPDDTIAPFKLFESIEKNPNLLLRLFDKTDFADKLNAEIMETPILMAIAKLGMLKNSECYIVETIKVFNDAVDKEEIRLETACEFVRYFTNRELRIPVSCYDIVMDIIGDLWMFKLLIQQKENLLIEQAENERRQRQAEEERRRKEEEERRQAEENEKRRQQEVAELERLRKEEQRRLAEEERKKQQYRAEGRKVDNDDDTITDYATGLMWQRLGSDTRLYFEQAVAYVQELNYRVFAGYSDWRLPTIEELKSLLIKQSGLFSIDPIFDGLYNNCWSSSKSNSYYYDIMLFDRGEVYPGGAHQSQYVVRAVRNA